MSNKDFKKKFGVRPYREAEIQLLIDHLFLDRQDETMLVEVVGKLHEVLQQKVVTCQYRVKFGEGRKRYKGRACPPNCEFLTSNPHRLWGRTCLTAAQKRMLELKFPFKQNEESL